MSNNGFKKGQSGNREGRPKGSENKTTSEAKALFAQIMSNQFDSVNIALEKLKDRPVDYLNCLAKLMPYFLPKQTDITSNGQPINKPIIIDFSGQNNNPTDTKTD